MVRGNLANVIIMEYEFQPSRHRPLISNLGLLMLAVASGNQEGGPKLD